MGATSVVAGGCRVATCSHRVRAWKLHVRCAGRFKGAVISNGMAPKTREARAHGWNQSEARRAFERGCSNVGDPLFRADPLWHSGSGPGSGPNPSNARARRHVGPAIRASLDGGNCRHATDTRLGARARASDSCSPPPRHISNGHFHSILSFAPRTGSRGTRGLRGDQKIDSLFPTCLRVATGLAHRCNSDTKERRRWHIFMSFRNRSCQCIFYCDDRCDSRSRDCKDKRAYWDKKMICLLIDGHRGHKTSFLRSRPTIAQWLDAPAERECNPHETRSEKMCPLRQKSQQI